MRGFAGFLLSFSLFGAHVLGAEPSFPYVAAVSVDAVEVRCGPGGDYYPTGKLRRGQEVKVYRHAPGGWLGIRPPEGSFSWITARQLEPTADQAIGKVAVDGAVAWVGSTFLQVGQLKWQVRLKRGEPVGILGERAISVGPGFATETHYKIAPPSGEFRWIRAENTSSPHLPVASSRSGSSVQFADYQTAQRQKTAGAGQVRTAIVPAPEGKPIDPEALAKRMAELNVELSLLVTQQIEQWNLKSLRQRAEVLRLEAGDTDLARNIRAISQRISEFEGLQRRYRKLASEPPPVTRVEEPSEKPTEPSETDATKEIGRRTVPKSDSDWQEVIERAVGTGVLPKKDSPKDPVFDAEGWLMPVHSTKRVAPPFALLDDDGRVKCYVTPAPGLNLRRHVRSSVGLMGERRHVDALRASHITAERVVKQKVTR